MKIDRVSLIASFVVGMFCGILIQRYIAADRTTLGMAYPLALGNRMAVDLHALVAIESNHVDVASSLLKSDLKANMTSLVALAPEKQLTPAQEADLKFARILLAK